MTSLIHIAEVAALLFVAYQLAWFVGFALRRVVSRPARPVIEAAVTPVVAAVNEPPVRIPVIDPLATVPAAPSAAVVAVDPIIAQVAPFEAAAVQPPATILEADVAPQPVLTASDADVSPPPPPLSPDFLAELQSAMMDDEPEEEAQPDDPRTAAALSAAFEQAFELSPTPPEMVDAPQARDDLPAVSALAAMPDPETQPNLFDDWPTPPVNAMEVQAVPTGDASVPDAPPEQSPEPATESTPHIASIESVPAPSERTPMAPVPLAPDPMPTPPMAPATEPGSAATNARHPVAMPASDAPLAPAAASAATATSTDTPPPPVPDHVPEPSAPPAMPASKPGEVWSGRTGKPSPTNGARPGGILRPSGAPRSSSPGFAPARPQPPQPASRPPGEAVQIARDAVAAAAAKVKEVVAAAEYDDGMEASDEDAEAAAMRAIEGGWMRKAAPRKSRPDQPEGVPPAKPRKDT